MSDELKEKIENLRKLQQAFKANAFEYKPYASTLANDALPIIDELVRQVEQAEVAHSIYEDACTERDMQEAYAKDLKAERDQLQARVRELEDKANADRVSLASATEHVTNLAASLDYAERGIHVMRTEYETKLAEKDRLLTESNAVCVCGCRSGDHESYGEDGESCSNDNHQCIRTSVAVRDIVAEKDRLIQELRVSRNAELAECQQVLAEKDRQIARTEERNRRLELAIKTTQAENTRLREALTRLLGQLQRSGLILPGDWACRECHPNSDMLKEGFQCGYHQAVSIAEAQKEKTADPCKHPHLNMEGICHSCGEDRRGG